jgi:hypothetical protein
VELGHCETTKYLEVEVWNLSDKEDKFIRCGGGRHTGCVAKLPIHLRLGCATEVV